MEWKYFNREEQEYLQNAKSLNDKMNMFNNSFIARFPKDKLTLNFQVIFGYEPIKMINNYCEDKLSFSDKFYYTLIMFLLKRFFDFDILKLKKDNKFIDIIIIKLIDNLEKKDIVELSKEILNELVDILFEPDIPSNMMYQGRINYKEKKRENIAKIFQFCISCPLLKGSATIKPKGNTLDGDYSYEHKLKEINNFLNDWLVPDISDNENKLPLDKNNTKSKEDNIQDEHEEKYKAIYDSLKKYITYASAEKIKKIIQYKINNETINSKHNKLYFALVKNKVLEAAKIGKCFCLNKSEITHFIRLNEDGKRTKISKTIPTVNLEVLTEGIDKVLIKIRNEYLHEIDPKVFPEI